MLLEVCVDDAPGLAEAMAGGADRVELCAALGVGGLTPSAGLMELAATLALPCYPMIRPRTGNFVFAPDEMRVMRADIRLARALGLTGVVLGASRPDGRLDGDTLATLIAEATGMDLTLHRAVDLTPDCDEAVAVAVELGFHRILTSGGALRAVDGLARLDRMIRVADGRLSIMPGSGVSVQTWPQLSRLAITEVHASCATAITSDAQTLQFGFQSAADKRTDRILVAKLKSAIAA